METQFLKLNDGWNAEPNAPDPEYSLTEHSLWVRFKPNGFKFPEYANCSQITLEFVGCSQFRFTMVNDEAWYAGGCRFSKLAPHWGEFYQVDGDFKAAEETTIWSETGASARDTKNYLLYFRDETLECSALNWRLGQTEANDESYQKPFP